METLLTLFGLPYEERLKYEAPYALNPREMEKEDPIKK